MNRPSKTPAYNLKVVIRETGLKARHPASLGAALWATKPTENIGWSSALFPI